MTKVHRLDTTGSAQLPNLTYDRSCLFDCFNANVSITELKVGCLDIHFTREVPKPSLASKISEEEGDDFPLLILGLFTVWDELRTLEWHLHEYFKITFEVKSLSKGYWKFEL